MSIYGSVDSPSGGPEEASDTSIPAVRHGVRCSPWWTASSARCRDSSTLQVDCSASWVASVSGKSSEVLLGDAINHRASLAQRTGIEEWPGRHRRLRG